MKQNKQKTSTGIKKPVLVLNNAQKFYLATKEISNVESDLFFIISLFLPVNKGSIFASEQQTEISAFDDANSAAIYRETLEQYCKFNANTQIGKGFKETIAAFKNTADLVVKESEEKVR